MKSKQLLPILAVFTAIVLMGCPTIETPQVVPVVTPDATISLVDITGITAPVSGATPVTTITETAQYTGTVEWDGSPTTFASSTVYTATITLKEKAGYTFSGVRANCFTVTGATTTNSVGSGIVTAVFPTTLLLYMINIPAGTFQRDSTAGNISVIRSSYKMSAYEITRAQFKLIIGTDPSVTLNSSGITDPVQNVKWSHAIAFCNKLSLAEGLTPVYSVNGITDWANLTYASISTISNADWNATTATWTNNGYRLPTEMEWMWAAMGAPSDGQGGGTNTIGYTTAFAGSTGSNAIGNYAVFGYGSGLNGATTTQRSNPIGSKQANELGLYDMSGNVWEWCWDWNDAYPTGTQSDYRGATSGSGRVRRGGCWFREASLCTIANRDHLDPNSPNSYIGFRVVRN